MLTAAEEWLSSYCSKIVCDEEKNDNVWYVAITMCIWEWILVLKMVVMRNGGGVEMLSSCLLLTSEEVSVGVHQVYH